MRHRSRRLALLGAGFAILAAALALAAFGLKRSAAFFVTPSELASGDGVDRSVRVGGLVEIGSVTSSGTEVTFTLVDDESGMTVRYAGVLPNLFREGQCVIAEGRVGANGELRAERVLAKHDESYVPREIENETRLARSCGRPGGATS